MTIYPPISKQNLHSILDTLLDASVLDVFDSFADTFLTFCHADQ